MRLELRYPAGWSRRPFEGGELVTIPGFAFVPDLTLEVLPLLRRLDANADALLARRLPPAARLVAGAARIASTDTGWAMNLVEARVTGDDGAHRETRLLCCYSMLVFTGVVLVRAIDPRRFASEEDAIVEVLRTARPRFRDTEPAEISELWDMELDA